MRDPGHQQDDHAPVESGAARKSKLSRRQVMTATAVAAGVGLASVPAQADAATGGAAVSLGEPGTTTVEFRGRITQSGPSGQRFTGYGFLIRATHAQDDALFDGTPPRESTALLTIYADGRP